MLKHKFKAKLPPKSTAAPLPTGSLTEATQRIHENIKAIKACAEAIRTRALEIGRDLIEVKKHKAKPGGFLPYIKAEFQMNERTAQRYMRAFEFTEQNPDMLDEELPLSALHALAGANFAPEVLESIKVDVKKGSVPKTGAGIKKAIAAKQVADNVVELKPSDPAKQKEHDMAVQDAIVILIGHLPEETLQKFIEHCAVAGWRELAKALKGAAHGPH